MKTTLLNTAPSRGRANPLAHLYGCLFAILLPLPATALLGQATTPEDAKLKWKKDYTLPVPALLPSLALSEDSWWSEHYVNSLGLALFDKNLVAVPKLRSNEEMAQFGTTLDDDKPRGLSAEDVYYPLADSIPGRRLADGTVEGLFDGAHTHFRPVVLLRMQDDLTSKPNDAQPGTLLWENDRGSNRQSTMVNTALLLDVYFCGWGRDHFGGHGRDRMFHLIFGAELERYDSGKSTPDIDIRRYSALAEFSPGAVLGIPSILGKENPRQRMSIGWLFEDNLVDDVQRHSFQVKYNPSFLLPFTDMLVGERSYFRKWFDFIDKDDWDKAKGSLLSNLLNAKQSVPQGDKADGTAVPKGAGNDGRFRSEYAAAQPGASSVKRENLDNFFYIRPNVGLDFGQSSVSNILRTGDLPDLNLIYTVETGLSFMRETYHIGYRVTGFAGLSGGSNRRLNEFFLQVTPHGWPGRVFATYKQGKVAPAFNDVDVFQVGVGFKF